MKWWETSKRRFLKERNALKSLSEDNKDFTVQRITCYAEELRVFASWQMGDSKKEFLIVYPPLFPAICPSIRPQKEEAWSSHQYGAGGTLCLEIGPDNWDPEKYTGADLIRSLSKLLLVEGVDDTKVDDRHSVTAGQDIRGNYQRFVSTGQDNEFGNTTPFGDCKLKCTLTSGSSVWWIEEFPKGSAIEAPHGLGHGSILERDGVFFRIPISEKDVAPLMVRTSLAAMILRKVCGEEAIQKLNAVKDSEFVVVIAEGNIRVLFSARRDDDDRLLLVKVPGLSSDNVERVDPEVRKAFQEKRVAIVGLGSIGSKVAVSLARIGIEKFVLVDDEIIEFGNVVRHEATLADVATHKTDMVADLIEHIKYDRPSISKFPYRLAGQENPKLYSDCVNAILECDVVVDCTANPDVLQLLGTLVAEHSKPMAWAEVFAGGIGGLVNIADPSCTLTPLTINRNLNDYLAIQPDAPFKDSETRYGGGPLVADDNEVTTITSILVYRIKQTILGHLDEFEEPTWLVGLSEKWIFDKPYQIKKVPCRFEEYPNEVWGSVAPEFQLNENEQKQYDLIIKEIKE